MAPATRGVGGRRGFLRRRQGQGDPHVPSLDIVAQVRLGPVEFAHGFSNDGNSSSPSFHQTPNEEEVGDELVARPGMTARDPSVVVDPENNHASPRVRHGADRFSDLLGKGLPTLEVGDVTLFFLDAAENVGPIHTSSRPVCRGRQGTGASSRPPEALLFAFSTRACFILDVQVFQSGSHADHRRSGRSVAETRNREGFAGFLDTRFRRYDDEGLRGIFMLWPSPPGAWQFAGMTEKT